MAGVCHARVIAFVTRSARSVTGGRGVDRRAGRCLYYRVYLLLFDGDGLLWGSQLDVTFCADELDGEEKVDFSH
jgi:hypothetical protein